ncbi:MAG: YeeE/YedE family protein [Cocleimonas sp.]|nr:YeeE/YedE family protein [Cocleimonas sp.]
MESVSQVQLEEVKPDNKVALNLASTVLGTIFGFLLVSIGATNFDLQAQMFLFQDFQLPIVLGMAVLTGITGMWMLSRMQAKTIIDQDEMSYFPAPFSRRLVVGALIFGIGWGLTASCPGTAMAMVGEGKMSGLAVAFGILAGTFVFGLFNQWQHSR